MLDHRLSYTTSSGSQDVPHKYVETVLQTHGSDAHGTVEETVTSAVLEEDTEDPLEISLPSDNEETVDDVHINPNLDSQQEKTLLDMLYEFNDIFIDFTCALLVIRQWAFPGVFRAPVSLYVCFR